MFGLILTTAVTTMHLYVLLRARSASFFGRSIPRSILLGAGIVLWLLFFLGRVVGHNGTGSAAAVLEFAGMTWMGVLLLTGVCMLAADVATGFGFFLRRWAPSLRAAALAAGALLSVISLVQGLRPPVVDDYDVTLPGLPRQADGTVIVALSDMHLGPLIDGQWLKARIDQVRAERPDVVVLLGDIFEGHGVPEKELVATLGGLSAPLGVWAVLGNHEFHGRDHESTDLLGEAGIHVLRNARAEILPGLVLAGVDDLTANHNSARENAFISNVAAKQRRGATILLSHTPWQAERASKAGIGLMMCGHTHGGQIWPFGYLVRLRYPLLAGRYEVGPLTVIVSRGAGTWGPRMRLWRPGEILRVTLHSGTRYAAGSAGMGK